MRLFIAEKPSLGRAIAQVLGNGQNRNGYIEIGSDTVTWCFGHILRQYEPDEYDEKYKKWNIDDLPIVPETWKLKIGKDCAKQFKLIKELVAKADEIVHAGDPDREGQLLVDEVLEQVGNRKPVKRILLNALDEKSVAEALHDLRDNKDFTGLKNSALGRSRVDWLVGMNLTRAYTAKARNAGYDGVLKVGRVKTPTMALIVRRETEIQNFKPVNYFTVQAVFHSNLGNIPAAWQMPEDLTGLDNDGRLVDRVVADNLLKKFADLPKDTQGKIPSVRENKKQEGQRLPYSLSALQIEAGRLYGYSPQDVLKTMQALYEQKLTSYPRSDCDYLPENQLTEAEKILSHLGEIEGDIGVWAKNADLSIRSRAWNDKKISAHHAIIPTRIKADFSALTDMQKHLYALVAKAYIAQFYPVHIYLATQIEIDFAGEKFVATGRTVTEQGWKSLYQDSKEESDNDQAEPILPTVDEGQGIEYLEGKISAKVTKPPSRFTPATVIKAQKEIYKYVRDPELKAILKECSGIGTEATRASIIEDLQKAGFLELSKKFLVPTDKAFMAVKILPQELTYPDFTAMWEEKLAAVEKGDLPYAEFEREQIAALDKMLEQAKSAKISPVPAPANAVLCPACGKPMRRIKRKDSKYFWGCAGFPNCRTTADDMKGKPKFKTK